MALPKTPHYRPPPADPNTGRGHVSPLGGQVFTGVRNNMQLKQEARNRAQSTIPQELTPPRNGRQPLRTSHKG